MIFSFFSQLVELLIRNTNYYFSLNTQKQNFYGPTIIMTINS